MTAMRLLSWERREVVSVVCLVLFLLVPVSVFGQLGPENVLLLVNENSGTSRYIARLYRSYHPEIDESQVLYLSGLPDCSGSQSQPEDEIINRFDENPDDGIDMSGYEELIAQPIREYLTDPCYPERMQRIMCIVTTAGMPYRINDRFTADVVKPAGSNSDAVVLQERIINAASVESELSCLWITDTEWGTSSANRIVNPYQGYRGGPITQFPREWPGSQTFSWTTAKSTIPQHDDPKMEGLKPQGNYGTENRHFHAGHIYLTCRLDGPKGQGQSAVFAVRNMLERAYRASSDKYGVNLNESVTVFDDAPSLSGIYHHDYNQVFNLAVGQDFWRFEDLMSHPPAVPIIKFHDDYVSGFLQMTGSVYDEYNKDIFNGYMTIGPDLFKILIDRRTGKNLTQEMLEASDKVLLYATYGTNGDGPCSSGYLLTGCNGEPIFKFANGAVFTSIESFNAVTMFTCPGTGQAKIVDFITAGGTGAIGHCFEPQPDAAIDNEFLFYNLVADDNNDGWADLTFVEAAFTAIPYLSWSEVVIGDPLMRYCYLGNGETTAAWQPVPGDIDLNAKVNIFDIGDFKDSIGGSINSTGYYFDIYNDLCDLDQNGKINIWDIGLFKDLL